MELRDRDLARRFVLQGLLLQRVAAPRETLRETLAILQEAASVGQPLPPPGFVADLGRLASGRHTDKRIPPVPEGLPTALLCAYEDHVLGKLDTDATFARAADALQRYKDRDLARGTAFVLNQFRERAGFAGVELSPAVLKQLADERVEEVLAQAHESLQRDGLLPLLPELYRGLIEAARRTGEVLAPEDVFELEAGTALQPFAQRLALRQVVQAATRLGRSVSQQKPRMMIRRHDVPTRLFDDDAYPVGGYTSLSTRGSLESLLHSQLDYMEKDERPDLFDIKYLRDELLYYARDENVFHRRRRSYVFVFFSGLVRARFKDADLPWQRGILLFGLVLTVVRKLIDWLSDEALSFHFLFVADGEIMPLAEEQKRLETLLHELIEAGTATVRQVANADDVVRHCTEQARRSLCHALLLAADDVRMECEGVTVTRLCLDCAYPGLGRGGEEVVYPEADDSLDGWETTLQELLQLLL